MTREEAIQYIGGLRCEEDFPYADAIAYFVKERNEAIDMAIEALQTDAVSREMYDDVVQTIIKREKQFTNMVSVVRCKDCKHWHSNTEFCGIWSFQNIAQRTLSDDYCSRAERREE